MQNLQCQVQSRLQWQLIKQPLANPPGAIVKLSSSHVGSMQCCSMSEKDGAARRGQRSRGEDRHSSPTRETLSQIHHMRREADCSVTVLAAPWPGYRGKALCALDILY